MPKTREEINEYNKEWYKKSKDKRVAANKRWEEKTRQWFVDYKSNLKCSNCPEDDSVCLEFHHPDPSVKEKAVSELVYGRFSSKKILEEIEKCVVLCANCHRKQHAKLKDET